MYANEISNSQINLRGISEDTNPSTIHMFISFTTTNIVFRERIEIAFFIGVLTIQL
jgi:hypothetical protein